MTSYGQFQGLWLNQTESRHELCQDLGAVFSAARKVFSRLSLVRGFAEGEAVTWTGMCREKKAWLAHWACRPVGSGGGSGEERGGRRGGGPVQWTALRSPLQ